MTSKENLIKKRSVIKGQLTRAKNKNSAITIDHLSKRDILELKSRLEKIEPLWDSYQEVQLEIELLITDPEAEISESEDRDKFENEFFSVVAETKHLIESFTTRSVVSSVVPSDVLAPSSINSLTTERESTSQGSSDNNISNVVQDDSSHILGQDMSSGDVSDNNNVHNIPTTQTINIQGDVGNTSTNSQVIQNNLQHSVNTDFSRNFQEQFVKLPVIKLPIFNGHYERWYEFRDSFKVLVHYNSSLSDIQRFYYLKSSLQGEASEIIQSFEVSATNYSIAWKFLEDRFENKRLIIHNHVKAIFEFPRLQRESHTELRKLFDSVTRHLRSLNAIGEPTEYWDTLLIYIIVNKFDAITRRDWESYDKIGERNIPTMGDLNKFLRNKCDILEKLQFNKIESKQDSFQNKHKFKQSSAHVSVNNDFKCYFCKQKHSVYHCESLSKLPVNVRFQKIQELKLCTNCLRPSHNYQSCKSSACRKCNMKHNTILCESGTKNQNSHENEVLTAGHTINNLVTTQVLLSTAIVQARDSEGHLHKVRCLLDNGSQSNFITLELCNRLGLKKIKVNYAVKGVGEALSSIRYRVDMKIHSCFTSYSTSITCLVLSKITEELPSTSFNLDRIPIPPGVTLADSTFNKKGKIELLLGSGIFWNLLSVGQIKLNKNGPILQKTLLGWIVTGNMSFCAYASQFLSCLTTGCSISDQTITRFWQIEEPLNVKKPLSKSEEYCETYFTKTHTRGNDGKFVVKIPFTEEVQLLGNSRQQALDRFASMERKLEKNSSLRQDYNNFMREYEELGHMSRIIELNEDQAYYLPHHAIVKTSSLTTKTRVVFDGSMKTDNGRSLNGVQFVGPTIQDDIFSILLRFRKHKYVMTGDISKMYRMIWIDTNERKYQRIFWRASPNEELQCFELNTVTYGTASAPFLAVRCLWQVALDKQQEFPSASQVIKEDFYMDDLLTGSDSREALLKLQQEISEILANAGFDLRKWLSNDKKLLDSFKVDSNVDMSVLNLGKEEQNKTLGVLWNASCDTLQYSICSQESSQVTKRIILSVVSQIFDPLGLLGPVIIRGKLIIQNLWRTGVDWDESVPVEIYTSWRDFQTSLRFLNEVRIPRWILQDDAECVELHGFSDASEVGYGASIYIRSKRYDSYTSKLLCAKSRVAPLKKITLPRLELCGAVLLAKLFSRVKESIKMNLDKCFFWSDSTITLSWIKASPSRWKTFVANRVSEIQRLTNSNDWHHVRSSENPADLLSRGCQAQELLSSKLWWEGPDWLSANYELNQCQRLIVTEGDQDDLPEQRVTVLTITNAIADFTIFDRYSSLIKLQRIVAYCLRFSHNVKVLPNDRRASDLTASELNESMNLLLKIAQMQSFPLDYENLSKGRPVGKTSTLLSLAPYVDQEGLIRVGGRISNADCSFSRKHPIVLSSKHRLTKLIYLYEHIRLMHCGPQQLLSSVREQYWPIAGRNLAKQTVHKCIKCFRAKPTNESYMMGNLPSMRVNQYLPFSHTGIDYAGPYIIKDRKTRPIKTIKCYISLFICMTTRAVHLETVTDLSSESFISMFKRFVSRRGRPSDVYSDNGTAFVGANNRLRSLQAFFDNQSEQFMSYITNEKIKWHFIPPRSPSFGGLWEAGIKSMKHHLKRVIGNSILGFEEFITVLTQVEAILNSRPISPLTNDPSDYSSLTPAHFLIGRSLSSLPEPSVLNLDESRLNKFQKLQQIIQHFWKRWHTEYVSELQTRVKWKFNSSSLLKVGSLVLVKEDNVPPLQWPLGRISELFPGDDGVCRVVTVKMHNGSTKRAVSKICVLPVDE